MELYLYCSDTNAQRGFFLTRLEGDGLVKADLSAAAAPGEQLADRFLSYDVFRALWMEYPAEDRALFPTPAGGLLGLRGLRGQFSQRDGVINLVLLAGEEELEKLENTAAFLMSDLNGFSKRLCACLSVGGPWGYQADGCALTRLLEEAGRASGTLPPGARPRQEARSKRDLLRLAVYTGAWERAAEQLGGGLLWRLPPRQALDREKFARLYPSCGAFLE